MLTMISEETENSQNLNEHKETTDSMSGTGVFFREENFTFPRRSRCPKLNKGKIDWAQLLAEATEEDKKRPEVLFSDEEVENIEPNIPVNLSSAKKGSSDDMVLDLSSMNKSLEPIGSASKKGYTLPSYQPPSRYQSQTPRGMPLKHFNSQVKNTTALNNKDLKEKNAAKKSLFTQKEVYYEKEIVTQKHVAMCSGMLAPRSEIRVREVEYIQKPEAVPDLQNASREAIEGNQSFGRKYYPVCYPPGDGNPSSRYHSENGFPTPSQTTGYGRTVPSQSIGYQTVDTNPTNPLSQRYQPAEDNPHYNQHVPHSNVHREPQQDALFAVPQPRPQKQRVPTKELAVNGKSYQILALLGKGGSSKVFLVLAKDNSLLAIKCVNLGNVDEKTKRDHLNEIEHLMKMQYCRHIIKIIDHQYIPAKNLLFAVMERGDTDLSRILKERTTSGEGVPPEMILFYWSEMLLAVKSIHDNNIIHRDLKPANFLLVSGRLKLIDFGIASAIQSEQTSVFKDSQSGTPNYMSPEAWEDLGEDDNRVVKIGRKTDVWSLGCILYSFLYGKTPFQEYSNPMAKFRAIVNPNHKVPFPPVKGVPEMLIESCRRCLIHDKSKRASIEELLQLKSEVLLTPPEVLDKLKKCLSDEAFKTAKSIILMRDSSIKIENS